MAFILGFYRWKTVIDTTHFKDLLSEHKVMRNECRYVRRVKLKWSSGATLREKDLIKKVFGKLKFLQGLSFWKPGIFNLHFLQSSLALQFLKLKVLNVEMNESHYKPFLKVLFNTNVFQLLGAINVLPFLYAFLK